ncbi:hypothetical protein XACG115_1930007 [Xanthomonas citri pv. citri]|nr:hypothetical protein XACG115_1930007 [Xanthomonas citri pv. citri]
MHLGTGSFWWLDALLIGPYGFVVGPLIARAQGGRLRVSTRPAAPVWLRRQARDSPGGSGGS